VPSTCAASSPSPPSAGPADDRSPLRRPPTIAALAGILITARTGSGQPVSGSEGLEFQSITAAALGGVALCGGKGSIGGTILAVILLGILLNGMSLLGVNPFWQNLAQGTLLVAAVVIQQVRNGKRRVGLPK
jgi:ribose transport system permease protein